MSLKVFKIIPYLFLLMSTASLYGQGKDSVIFISGKLKNFGAKVEVQDMSEFQYLLPSSPDRMITPEADSSFKISFTAHAPNYYRLGRNILYLTPGDSIYMEVNYMEPTDAIFKGDAVAANTYLEQTPFPKGGSYIEAGINVKPTIEETIAYVEMLATKRKKDLDKLKGVTLEFKRLEYGRIKADLINSIMKGEHYSISKYKESNAEEFSRRYREATHDKLVSYCKDFVDTTLLKLVVYRDISDELVKWGGTTEDKTNINDWAHSMLLVRTMQRINDKNILKNFKDSIVSIKTSIYRNAVLTMLAKLTEFGKGDKAVDFTAVDLKGNKVSLSSLKGKVIYLDLWATWCGPCLAEMPKFEQLKEKYKDNPDVAIVSLSIDDHLDLWRKNVDRRKAGGLQWNISREKLLDYNIVSVPRTMLFDKNFIVSEIAGPLPSSKELSEKIDLLLEQGK